MPLVQTQPHTDSAAAFVPDQSRAERPTSFDQADFAAVTGREEEWRFTPVDRLGRLLSDTPSDVPLSVQAVLPNGVTLSTITGEDARALGAQPPGDLAAALAFAHSGGAQLLDIGVEADIEEPIRVALTGAHHALSHAHLVIKAGRHSRATVVVEHSGSTQLSQLVSTLVGDSANLTVVSLQTWDDDAIHLGQHDATVGRDADYRHVTVTLGGKIVRLGANVRYAGPGASATLLGVYFADAGQHLEHRSFVDHGTPRCTSRVTYKGALQGDTAHTVWVGDVLIRAEAEGTDTYELNRNLVLTDGARADSVPNLEIETGEIAGAGHASATGRFDDEQLFYLRARGIREDEARRLVVRGFFADVVAQIGVPDVQAQVMSAIEAELEQAAEAGSDLVGAAG